jgi:hypothetical protein
MDDIDPNSFEIETEENPCGCGKETCRVCQIWEIAMKIKREAEEQARNIN